MAQTGHRSLAVARSYIRSGSLFRDNAAARWGCKSGSGGGAVYPS
jgi:hypothetical protein